MADPAGTVILLGILQGAGLVVVLARRPTDHLANRFLAALIGSVVAMLLLGYLSERWGFHGYPHLIALGGPIPFLIGPLLYLYIAALTRPIARFDPRFLVHGLLFVVDVLYMVQAFYLKRADEKLALVRESLAGGAPLAYRLLDTIKTAQGFAYVLASLLALRRYGRKIEGYFSDLTRIDLRWLTRMVIANAAVWSVVLAGDLLQAMGARGPAVRAVDQATQIASALVVFLIGYVSLWQPEVFQKALAAQTVEAAEADDAVGNAESIERVAHADASKPSARAPRERPKYQRNRLDDREAEEFARKLTALMEGERAYLDSALTLPVLADTLGTTPHLLSQVLNVRIGRSFYDFVNSYRTEALKAALTDPARQDRGVLELGFEVGFNSKSSLNSFFKKHTGLTPTEFRRRARASRTQSDAA